MQLLRMTHVIIGNWKHVPVRESSCFHIFRIFGFWPTFTVEGGLDQKLIGRQCSRTAAGALWGVLAQHASLNARMRLRTAWHGTRILLSSFAPVLGEVSLRSSHCVMALRSYMKPSICADSTARVGARGLNGAKVRDAPCSRGRS